MTNLNKNKGLSSFITTILCIVGIGAVSIFTIFQTNAENDGTQYSSFGKFNFSSGIDDKTTTLQKLNFTNQSEQTDVISSFYMRENSIILTPSMTLSGYDNSGNILGGILNQTESENITIIGGFKNTEIGSGNKTILGGSENRIGGDSNSSIVGGSNNNINGDGSIIGGSDNRIEEDAENVVIIGGTNNVINDGSNIIVAGEKIQVSSVSNNSFIFSNSSSTFSPEKGNTFYINAQEGLGLNGDGNGGIINSHGGLSVGEITLDSSSRCTHDKIGIIGKFNGCLIACTEYSSLEDKWSLLEGSQECIDWCEANNGVCANPSSFSDINHTPIPGFCTGQFEAGSTLCFTDRNPDEYKDVVFVNNYVDECPNDQRIIDNPCTYKCPEGQLYRDGSCKKSCTKTGDNGEEIIIPHGESIKLYNQNSPTCPNSCISRSRKCVDGNLEGGIAANYRYTTCQIKEGNKCDSSFNIEAGDKLTGGVYSSCTEYTINGNSCSGRTRYKLTSCQNGYTLSGGICYKNCEFNGISVPFGKTITGYKYESVTCDKADLCKSYRTLTCKEGGSFDAQEYSYSKCSLKEVNCPSHTLNSCPSNGICSTCTGYTLNNNQCIQFVHYKLDSCISGYSIDGNTCKADCNLPWGGSIQHNKKVTGYKSGSQYCPSICSSSSNKKEMTCNDGTLNGSETYIYSGCTTKVPTSKGYTRNTKVNHANCESEIIYSVNNNICVVGQTKYKCTSCEEGYTRNGQDWDGNNVQCLKNCSFTALPNNNTIDLGNGESITTYSKGTFTCPQIYSDFMQTRTCENGSLSGSFLYTSYTQTGTSCEIENTEEAKTFTHSLNETNDHVKLKKAACKSSQYNGTTCVNGYTYYTYTCKPNYKWSSDGTKCIGCEGDIPANAHKNNSYYPSNNSTDYYYSSDTSLACTFSCDEGFSREDGQCVSNNGKCYIEGIAYNEGTNITAYEEKNPICSNICNQIRIQCRNGIWYDYNNYNSITGDISSTCSTKTGYTTNTITTPIAGSCSYTSNSSLRTFTGSYVYKEGATLSKKCTNYRPTNSTKCNTGVTYRTYSCAGIRTGTSGNEECVKYCTHNGDTYEDGDTLTMYNKGGYLTCPNVGTSQTRTCKNGNRYSGDYISDFGSNYIYSENDHHILPNTCDENEYPLTSKPAGNKREACTYYGILNNECKNVAARYKQTECSGGYTMVSGACKLDCELDGQKVVYGQSITAYNYPTKICPNSCSYQIRTCGENGNLNGSNEYKYTRCYTMSNNCSSSEYPYTSTNDIPTGKVFKTCTGYTSNGNSCEPYYRYKIDEEESCTGSMVNGECKPDCYFNGQKIKYGNSVTGYISTTCPGPCFSSTRTCGENGVLLGNSSYSKSECTFTSGTNCASEYNLTTCPNNGTCSTCTKYNLTNNSCVGTDKHKFIKCNTGFTHVIVNGTDECKKNCTGVAGLGEVAHGGYITAYQVKNGECKSLVRYCNDGTLDGDPTYNLKECETCLTPRGESVGKGASITAYTPAVCPSTSCSSQTLTCTDEYIGKNLNFYGGYINKTCIVHDNKSSTCTDEHIYKESDKEPGYVYTGGCVISKYNGNSCSSVTYFKKIGCAPGYTPSGDKCLSGCSTPRNSNVAHDTTVTGYISTSMMCSDSSLHCIGEARKCLDGKRYKGDEEKDFGAYTNRYCNMTSNNCSNFPYTESEIDTTNCNYSSCTIYTVENGACKSTGKKYALYSVQNSGYYATGSTCNRICGDGISVQCNGPYSATGYNWEYGPNLWGNLWGNSYICNKNNSSVQGTTTTRCYCPNGYLWDGSSCVLETNPLCKQSTVYGCNNSYPINKRAFANGNTRTCVYSDGGEIITEDCSLAATNCNCVWDKYKDDFVSIVESIDGKCAFDGTYCSVGEKDNVVNITNGESRFCRGSGDGKDQHCRLQWSCGSGSCILDPQGGDCTSMYYTYSEYQRSDCENAAMYYRYENDKPGIQGRGPCYIHNQLSSATYPWNNNNQCSSLDDNLYDGVSYTARSCFKWSSDLQCIQEIDGTATRYTNSQAVSKCDAIRSKAPSTCNSSTWIYGNGQNGYTSTPKCHKKSYMYGCAAVYGGNTPVTNGWTGADYYNTQGLENYCKNKDSAINCESVEVIKFNPSGSTFIYTSPGWIPDSWFELDANKGKRSKEKCCEWDYY